MRGVQIVDLVLLLGEVFGGVVDLLLDLVDFGLEVAGI